MRNFGDILSFFYKIPMAVPLGIRSVFSIGFDPTIPMRIVFLTALVFPLVILEISLEMPPVIPSGNTLQFLSEFFQHYFWEISSVILLDLISQVLS